VTPVATSAIGPSAEHDRLAGERNGTKPDAQAASPEAPAGVGAR
jgi:hypothetical protein